MADQINGSQQTESAETGGQQPGNVESLSSIMAGATGTKPAENPETGGNAKGNETAGGGTAGAKLAPWTEQLPEDLRGNPDHAGKLAQFAKVGDMAKAYLELEGKLSGAATVPGADASPETVAAFWEKAGKPNSAEGYAFAKEPDAAPFAQLAHESNLTNDQAQAVYTRLKALGQQQAQALQQQQMAEYGETERALKEEYGSRYPEKIEFLKRGMQAAGPSVGALLQNAGVAGHPDIVRAFIRFGEMTAESGGARGTDATRLKSIMEGGGFAYS
ncbi:MAG: hypothetical protein LBG14_00825 [Treponema sp.]|jgi:hypothetical protein|nr:hypothetical protein [Treponema sp.]